MIVHANTILKLAFARYTPNLVGVAARRYRFENLPYGTNKVHIKMPKPMRDVTPILGLVPTMNTNCCNIML